MTHTTDTTDDPGPRPDRWADATAVAEAIAAGVLAPTEAVDDAIARIEDGDPAVNAVPHRRFEAARAEAAAVVPGSVPFAGVPLLLKDLGAPMAGEPHHVGTAALKAVDHREDEDSHIVRRLRAAGFVVLGRTNVPALGVVPSTEPEAYGPTRNPWAPGHSAGGSSGGSAAAVAAGFVPAAHASDGGGSIRIPASHCGVVGLKPSRGRVSAGPQLGITWMGAAIDGAVTRTVRDTAALLDVLAGYEPGDPVTAPAPDRPYREEVGRDPGRLRVGVLDHPPFPNATPDPDAAAGVRRTADALADLGHDVTEAWPASYGEDELRARFFTMMCAYVAAEVAKVGRLIGREPTEDDVEAGNRLLATIGAAIPAVDLVETEEWLHRWSRRTVGWWCGDDAFDILLCPVLNGPPPPLGAIIDPAHGSDLVVELAQYTIQANATGQPAISLPLHHAADGRPLGVQAVAAPYREDVLVRLAAQLEQARPWADHHPVL